MPFETRLIWNQNCYLAKLNRTDIMEEPKLNLNEKKEGAFVLTKDEEQLAEMVVAIVNQDLIVYHTEVVTKAEGQGLAKILLNSMVAYARKEGLKVVPLCAFVHAQFKRYPEKYADVWNKN
jgi:predicted GNAT family acetyltransferase